MISMIGEEREGEQEKKNVQWRAWRARDWIHTVVRGAGCGRMLVGFEEGLLLSLSISFLFI